MENNKDNKESNTGCIIAIVLFVLVNIIVTLVSTSKEEITSWGAGIMCLAGLCVGIYIIKALSNKGDSSSPLISTESNGESTSIFKGCLIAIGCIVILGICMAVFTRSNELNFMVGALFVIVFAVGFGIWVYNGVNKK